MGAVADWNTLAGGRAAVIVPPFVESRVSLADACAWLDRALGGGPAAGDRVTAFVLRVIACAVVGSRQGTAIDRACTSLDLCVAADRAELG